MVRGVVKDGDRYQIAARLLANNLTFASKSKYVIFLILEEETNLSYSQLVLFL